MKTLAAFNRAFEAHMLVARLESSGIPAYTRDEHMVTLDWLAANAIGGVKVDVADEDYERALAVMEAPTVEAESAAAAGGAPSLNRGGAAARVKALDRSFKRGVAWFCAGAVPLGALVYFVTPAPKWNPEIALWDDGSVDPRPMAATLGGALGGVLVLSLAQRKKAKAAGTGAKT